MNEVWKTLVYQNSVFSEKYEVSNLGRIRNNQTGTILRLFENRKGYLQVHLSNGRNKNRVVRVHKAVAETFLPEKREKDIVNHIDGNKQNNCVENLEWCSLSENTLHAMRLGLIDPEKNCGERNGNKKLTKEQVEEIKRLYKPYDRKFGTRGLSKMYGVDHMTISRIVRGKTWNKPA